MNLLLYNHYRHLCRLQVYLDYNQIKEIESEHWTNIFLFILITGFNTYINIAFKNRLNIKLMQLNIIFSLLFFGFNEIIIFLTLDE